MWKDIGIGVLLGVFFSFQLALLFFAFFPPANSLVDQALITYSKDVVGPILTGLGGAMLGAFAAYNFQKNSEATKEFNDSVRVLRLTKFQLIQKLNELVSVKINSVVPVEGSGMRFILIGYIVESPVVKGFIDSKLLDMLVSEKAVDAIEDVLMCDQYYFSCFELFKVRNQQLADFKNKLIAVGLADNLGYSLEELAGVVEPARITALYNITENMLRALDESIKSLDNALSRIGEALDKKYSAKGGHVFAPVKYEPELFDSIKPSPLSFDVLLGIIDKVHAARR